MLNVTFTGYNKGSYTNTFHGENSESCDCDTVKKKLVHVLQQEVEKITTNIELEDREITETLLNSISEFHTLVLLHYYVFVRTLMIRRIKKVTTKTWDTLKIL